MIVLIHDVNYLAGKKSGKNHNEFTFMNYPFVSLRAALQCEGHARSKFEFIQSDVPSNPDFITDTKWIRNSIWD